MSNRDWKVVCTDNFGMSGENPGRDEWFVLTYGVRKELAESIANLLNGEEDKFGFNYFKPVSGEYKLAVFVP